jgi:hypothetical protein
MIATYSYFQVDLRILTSMICGTIPSTLVVILSQVELLNSSGRYMWLSRHGLLTRCITDLGFKPLSRYRGTNSQWTTRWYKLQYREGVAHINHSPVAQYMSWLCRKLLIMWHSTPQYPINCHLENKKCRAQYLWEISISSDRPALHNAKNYMHRLFACGACDLFVLFCAKCYLCWIWWPLACMHTINWSSQISVLLTNCDENTILSGWSEMFVIACWVLEYAGDQRI